MVALHEDSAHTGVGRDNCDSGDPPVNRCTTCCIFLCEFCSQAHLQARDTRSHGMVSVEEAKKMGSAAMAKPSLCKEHKGEVMKVFCATCDKVICRDCTVVEHRDHEYTFVKEAYSKEKERLLNILSETKTRIPMLEEALESVSEMKTRIQCHAEQTVQDANKCSDALVVCVNIRRKQLIELTEELRKVKLNALQIQEEELETTLASVKNGVEFTEKSLKNSSEVDMLNMHKEMSSRLEGFNSAKWQLTPCTDDIVKLNVNMKQLTQAMKNFGIITDVETCAAMSTVTMDDGSEGVMCNVLHGEEITFTITAREQNGKKRRDSGDIFETKICCYKVSSTEWPKVKDCEDGTYTFTYTPQQVGQYDMSVKLNDCHVKGSPFRWKVEDLYTWYGTSTVTMGNGEEGVMYNTLCGQPVEFTINTQKQKHVKNHNMQHNIFAVEICFQQSPKIIRVLETVAVKDKGSGCYSFCYTPRAERLLQLSIKVGGKHIRGSPFAWKVVKWNLTVQAWETWKSFLNLVDENMKAQYIRNMDVWSFGIPSVLTSLGSVSFRTGKHSWKVRVSIVGNSDGFGIGVARSTEQNPLGRTAAPHPIQYQWMWTGGNPYVLHTSPICQNFTVKRFPVSLENNSVIELYLDCDNRKLKVYSPATKMSDTMERVEGPLFPAFVMCSNGDEVSLRL